ncbi:caspase family protein [Nitrococcus mobilis]|uniref:TPR repeat, SEL1 subfamily protein n=1 Tax=Nitrococcus mobilis Nb-231 TaxID=314278 RepID=A4BPK5_9GAMM|nr:caspase family protein [Nitrococcus mobilis]EAR22506.1 TPR repeat, SEL1 subfamily protein [Nitrococcus mobilis Nb-231]
MARSGGWGSALALIVLIGGCAAGGPDWRSAGEAAREGSASVDDLQIVDCLLPGQVRKLGKMTYLTARRPVRTTAVDCRIRGGEYVAYDRADYRSALNVWLERAEAGEAEAQNYVGEIFEKGLGRESDYVSAAQWYRKAAEQDYTRAQINLGYLYEKGLGVERKIATALNWYRRASGLSGDKLVYNSELEKAVAEQRKELQAKIEEAQQQAEVLNRQLQRLTEDRIALQRQGESAAVQLAAAQQQIKTLKQLYARARRERQDSEKQLSSFPKARSNVVPRPSRQPRVEQDTRILHDINFGRYYALIIGNQDYLYLEDLDSPMADARRMQQILEQRYGFSTFLLPNADEKQILNALNDLYDQLGPQDNLLIYYAGHGNLSERDEGRRRRGYWLPVNAQPNRFANWINNSVVSDHLDRIRARSIIVVADSCYAGTMASERSPLLLGSAQAQLSEEGIRQGIARRSRMVISSGGVQPVLDTLDGQHSLFARSLIGVLKSNDQILRDNMLFARVAVNVRRRAQANGVEQTPEMRPIRAAGHEGGDFFFVPAR